MMKANLKYRWNFLAEVRKSPSAELCTLLPEDEVRLASRFSPMKRSLWVLLAIGEMGPALVAQDALFRSLDAEQNVARLRNQVENLPYTARWKDLRVLLSPSVRFEWTDNVLLTERSPESDFTLSPSMGIHAFHPLGEANILSLDLGIGYVKYVDHTELDRLSITPGSSLAFDLLIKDFAFNFHERLTYQLDPALVGAVSGTGEFGGIDNTLGVLSTWRLNGVSLNFGYDYVSFLSSSSQFRYLNRNSHQVLLRSGFQIHPALTFGVEGTATPTVYDLSVQNDSVGYSAGGYGQLNLTEHLAVAPRAGYSFTTFSPTDAGFAPDDYGAFYFGLTLDHTPNDSVRYTLAASRQITPGVNANLSDVLQVRLDTTWQVVRQFPLVAGIFFEHGKQVAGLLAEKYDRVGGDVGLSYQLTQRANLGFTYGMILKSSERSGQGYNENRVACTFGYRL